MENRYDKYKDSGIAWIGEIPEHWDVIKIKQLLKNNSLKVGPFGSQLSGSDVLSDGKYWIYNQRTVLDNNFSSCNSFITHEKYNDLIGFKVNAGDILLTTRGTIGKISRVPTTFNEGVIHPCIIRFNINENILKYDILKYIFNDSDLVINQVKYNSNSTTIDVIYSDTLKNIILTCIPNEEQQSIATYLDQKCGEIDELITLQEGIITKLQSYKQSVITEAVTKGLDKNVPLKDSGIEWIGEIPEHWEVKRLKNVCSQINIKENSKENSLPYIGLENIESGSGRYIDTTSEVEGMANRFCKNNVLFGKLRPYLSKVYLAEKDGICSTEFIVYDTKSNNCRFIHKLLLSQAFIEVVNSSTYGAKMPRANSDFINNIYVQIPPLSEQQSIANYLDQKCSEIDELISIKQQKIEKLKDYKKSLIFECVTGKRKV